MKWVLFVLTMVLIVLHQDFWNWSKVDPRWFGFMPIGLWYHAIFCVAAAVLLAMFVAFMWPTHLENVERDPHAPAQDRAHSH
jgi:uncharacterized membrane protein